MSLIWRDQLNVGNDAIDQDHKQLVEIINRVENCLKIKDRDNLFEEMHHLSQYAQAHFIREERIAHLVKYPNAEDLHHSHQNLIVQLKKVKQDIEAMDSNWSIAMIENISNLLRNWLINHVIKEDLLMKPTLSRYPADFNPD